MRQVSLGQHVKLLRGITFKPADLCNPKSPDAVVCMRTKNVQVELDQSDLIAIPCTLIKNKIKMLRQGDILVSSANSWNLVGKCCRVPDLPYPSTAGGFISILRADEELNADYLYRWFSSDTIQHTLRSFGNQTTNISNLDHGRTLALRIPLPPIEEQKRIAAILDAADALRGKRRESIAQLDALLQSTFLDMFGDPVINQKGWRVAHLGEIASLDRGVSKYRPRNASFLLGGVYPLVQTGDVANSGGYIRNYNATYSELGLKQSKLWPAGTLCITIAANIAKTGLLTFDACFPDSVVGFIPDKDSCNVEYIQALFVFFQEILEKKAPQVAQKNINLQILRSLSIPLPPSPSNAVSPPSSRRPNARRRVYAPTWTSWMRSSLRSSRAPSTGSCDRPMTDIPFNIDELREVLPRLLWTGNIGIEDQRSTGFRLRDRLVCAGNPTHLGGEPHTFGDEPHSFKC